MTSKTLARSSTKYGDEYFRKLSEYPSENTLTVNLTHQQLNRLDPPFERLVAVAPSRYEEGANTPSNDPMGYDVKLETAKELVFQHKAPDNTVVRDGKQWLNYKVDMDQLRILFHRYNPRESFYALPGTPQHRLVRDGLDRTIFVDAWPVYTKYLEQGEEVSRIYVEYCSDPSTIPDVKVKFKTREKAMGGYPYRSLRSSDRIYEEACTWKPIEEHLKSCRLGLPIRGISTETYPYSETDRTVPGLENQYFDQFNPAYREHLKRRHALDQYLQRDEDRGELLEYLITSLHRRAEAAYHQDWHTTPIDQDFWNEQTLRLLRNDLDTLAEKQKPSSNYLTNTRRHILEKGNPESTITI